MGSQVEDEGEREVRESEADQVEREATSWDKWKPDGISGI